MLPKNSDSESSDASEGDSASDDDVKASKNKSGLKIKKKQMGVKKAQVP
jgi:hypothetical protein